jgi:hypothetical protein
MVKKEKAVFDVCQVRRRESKLYKMPSFYNLAFNQPNSSNA